MFIDSCTDLPRASCRSPANPMSEYLGRDGHRIFKKGNGLEKKNNGKKNREKQNETYIYKINAKNTKKRKS